VSTVATFGGKQRRRTPGAKGASKRVVHAGVIGLAQRRQPSADQRLQARRVLGRGDLVSRRPDFGDNFAAVGDQDAFTASDFAKVFAQAVLEFPDTNGLHFPNVAS
jgi:hypothetical protein